MSFKFPNSMNPHADVDVVIKVSNIGQKWYLLGIFTWVSVLCVGPEAFHSSFDDD